MHAASHIFQYPKVTPVAPQGAGSAKPSAGAQAAGAAGGSKRPQR
jgi:hypothetical protein